ncbi:RNA-directed DNA polymerase, eukaryota, reverse transcriptase zinc-binding domain protein [Tanacetum coccineum]
MGKKSYHVWVMSQLRYLQRCLPDLGLGGNYEAKIEALHKMNDSECGKGLTLLGDKIVDDNPWVLMGDWNVSLHLEDHSEGGSSKTRDMIKFQECLENIEVEDLNSSGVHFTWVQSRQNPISEILKKIDRVLGNIEFMRKFNNSHALFLPHMTFDHSPAVLIIPKMMKMKHKAFRFTNFIADKPNFLSTVQDE